MANFDMNAFDGYPVSDIGKNAVKRSVEEALSQTDTVDKITELILRVNSGADIMEGFDGAPEDILLHDNYRLFQHGVRVAVRTLLSTDGLLPDSVTQSLAHSAVATDLNVRAMMEEGAKDRGTDIKDLYFKQDGGNG